MPCSPRLNRRSLTNLLRNKMLFAARIGQTVFLGPWLAAAAPEDFAQFKRSKPLASCWRFWTGRLAATRSQSDRLHTPVRTFFAGLTGR